MEMFPISLDELQTEQSKFQIICLWVISGGKGVKLKGRWSSKYGIGLGGEERGRFRAGPLWLPLPVPVCLQHVRAGCLGQWPVWEPVFSAHITPGDVRNHGTENSSTVLSHCLSQHCNATLFLHIVKALMLFIVGVDWFAVRYSGLAFNKRTALLDQTRSSLSPTCILIPAVATRKCLGKQVRKE